MEVMLQAVVVIFMLFLCSLCLFAVIVIVRDIIHENAKTRRERLKDETAPEKEPQLPPITVQLTAPVMPQPEKEVNEVVDNKPEEKVEEKLEVVEEAKEVQLPQAEEAVTVDGNAVVFSKHTLTMAEKYAQLSSQYKKYFEEIARHALSKQGVRELKLNSSYDYKDASYRVVRLSIKRGEIIAEFIFIDKDFMNYANASDVKIKQSATQIKVIDSNSVGVVKDGIDLVVSQIAEYKEYKRKLANEKRREKRKKENA